MSSDLALADAWEQALRVRRREVTPAELVDSAIARIERLEPRLHALVARLFDEARAAARSPSLPDGPFRGVPFLWLPDISMKDPYYIIPLIMGGSMLVLSLIGMRAGPPNPQAKVMGYMMPVMFTFMFLNFASGLNLYYAVQNLVGIPQQWLLTREREKAATTPVVKGPGTKQRK